MNDVGIKTNDGGTSLPEGVRVTNHVGTTCREFPREGREVGTICREFPRDEWDVGTSLPDNIRDLNGGVDTKKYFIKQPEGFMKRAESFCL